jgi:hypothetical protein
MLTLFLDESGDHSLDKIDPQYPVFVLGGCLVDLEYHDSTMASLINLYKKELFQRNDFILHTADIVRRRGVFHSLTNKEFRDRFYEETNRLMSELDYMIIACGVKKEDHLKRYGIAALDPYMLSLKILVERFVLEIKSRKENERGIIVAEARDETLDNQLRLAWMDLRTSGTEYLSASEIRSHVTDLHIREKDQNIPGLQIADLIVSPIGRHIVGKSPKADWEVIRKKFRKGPKGGYMGYGLVVLPQKK